jgi:hypothetical protein
MPAKKKKLSKPVGKPPLIITKEIVEKAEALAGRGLTIEQIANCLGIGLSTLHNKRNQYQELEDAIKRGRDKGISIVANSLFENAKAGNIVAEIFYLKSRANWKETNVLEHNIKPHEDSLKDLE